ncbi:MAG: poly-beta-1,6-N-acetyl-D-glucosamine biosynthesis protein PgaD [Sulfuricaulis sp.]
MRDIFLWVRPTDNQRHIFHDNPIVVFSRHATELLVTMIFWGLWIYLITPLISLLLWFAGIYLFVNRMVTLGGYQAFAQQLVKYGSIVFGMWVALSLWVLWNLRRYGKRNRRIELPPHVTDLQLAEAMYLSVETISRLHSARQIYLYFDSNERPVIEKASSEVSS